MFKRFALIFALIFMAGPALADTVSVVVDLSEQRMYVAVDGITAYSWPVSTAGRGYITPKGGWKPTRMHARYFSRKYNNAPMPYSIFFYKGYAIHGTTAVKRLGQPASHGCVRLHPDNAKVLFEIVKQFGAERTEIAIRS